MLMKENNLDIVVRNLLEIFPPLMKKINTGDYMQQFELSPSLTRILFLLKYHSQLTLSEISIKMAITSSNCSRAIEELATLDYICRQPDPEDRRRRLITLSDQGEEAVERLSNKIHEEIKKHLSLLSPQDVMKLKVASEEIHQVLSKLN